MRQDNAIARLFGIELPIIQAPMAGSDSPDLAAAVSEAGGLGSLACALLSLDQVRAGVEVIRAKTEKPFNLNFFCHKPPVEDAALERDWKGRLASYYAEFGLDPEAPVASANRVPFNTELCDLVEDLRPPVVSFHFGLPDASLVARVKATGTKVISSATTVAEAVWLEQNGVDAIIAQGFEAGGHRGMFLTEDPASQIGTLALVPQIRDAVSLPVIAAGGIADGRGMAAALILGADAVQIGTAYLLTPEARPNPHHRRGLDGARDDNTVLTNVFTGRPARGLLNRLARETGPIAPVPAFPLASRAIAPLRAAAEAQGIADFTSLWSGQAAALAQPLPAGDLTRKLAADARNLLRSEWL